MRAPIFLLLGVMGLGAWTSACRIAWGSWSSCSRSCGGGKKTRTCDWGGTQSESCNEFCYNGNSYNGGCRCSAWRTGSCCEGCRYPGIAKCKPGKYECGGSPDGIRCTDCYLPYKPAGFNKGCVRKPCNENNGGCSHLCTAERLTRCTCRAGYQLSSDEYSCIDINECATHNGQCDQICTNSLGSYSCSCGPGFVLAYGSRSCNDIDECLTGTARCGHQCVNTNGSFKCTCDSGYRLNPDGLTCDDIDECKIGNGGCAHVCENIAGSYKCSCDTGYALHDGAHLCKDIDECDSGVSACSQICMNSNGTYHCECEAGFYLDNDTVTCKNINDCNAVVCENGGECVDGVEQYSCECQPGFSGKLCQDDVNECEGVFKAGCEDICVNTFGSYLCQCRDNVTLKSDGFSCSYDGEREDVFTRYSIGGRLLPKGCSKVAFRLESGTESTFWSTSD
ncbi:matrilin-2-like isoform X2 [Dreissena polymorpha]|uniref:EGF-like domain-containing protein n=1 Tax=Dreissena polymorpha TaxID=45954 RepID=A0A9D4FST8_DREPO|nr:matrilin-2-like isoform X2 [Dreissena polymorpha]KAH3801287.1 hypothetical protein DPMN_154935 [Dreissena polymorpha]